MNFGFIFFCYQAGEGKYFISTVRNIQQVMSQSVMQLYNNNKIKKHLLGNCIFFKQKKQNHSGNWSSFESA